MSTLRTRSALLLTWLLLLGAPLACGDDDMTGGDGGGDGDGGDGDGDGGTQESPRDGLWFYVDGGVSENTCGTNDVSLDDDTNFEIVNTGGSTFMIPQNEPYDDFMCTKSGDTFSCPARLKGERPVPETDIVLSYNVDVNGTIEDAESISGTQRNDISCAGSQCALAGTLGYNFPCYFVVDFSATWESEY
jgi:hypothetical protein